MATISTYGIKTATIDRDDQNVIVNINGNDYDQQVVTLLRNGHSILNEFYLWDISEDGKVIVSINSTMFIAFSDKRIYFNLLFDQVRFIGNNLIHVEHNKHVLFRIHSSSLYLERVLVVPTNRCIRLTRSRIGGCVRPAIDNNEFHMRNGRFFFVDHSSVHSGCLRMYDENQGKVNVVDLIDWIGSLGKEYKKVSKLRISISTDMKHILLGCRLSNPGNMVPFDIRYISRLVPSTGHVLFVLQNMSELTQQILVVNKRVTFFIAPVNDIHLSNYVVTTDSSQTIDYYYHNKDMRIHSQENTFDLRLQDYCRFSHISLPEDTCLIKSPLLTKIHWLSIYHKYRSRGKSTSISCLPNKRDHFLIKQIFDVLPLEIVEMIFSYLTNCFKFVTNTMIVDFQNNTKFK